jgi:hypothetical protein
MREELIRVIEDIKAQKKSGLLISTVQMVADNNLDINNPSPGIKAIFTFLFKEGDLAAIRYGNVNGQAAAALAASIHSVISTRWTATSAGTITIAVDVAGTDQLLELLGAKKAAAPVVAAGTVSAGAGPDVSDALVARCKEVFLQVLGRDSAKSLRAIEARFNPRTDPDGFLAACVAELEPLMGEQTAQDLLKG